jgi:hypothetical protein
MSVLSMCVAGLLALSFAAPCSAKRILRFAKVKTTVSVERTADGTITVKAVIASRNPKCIPRNVERLRNRDGYFHFIGGALMYGTVTKNAYPTGGYGSPPNNGWLSPFSRPSRTRWIWRAVWPANASVSVSNNEPHPPLFPGSYKTTVAAASGLTLGGGDATAKVKYWRNGNKIKLTCGGSEIPERKRISIFS